MPIFNDDTKSWSLWTEAVESFAGKLASPSITQVNSILRPLDCRSKWPELNTFRKLVVADGIPTYSRTNQNAYSATGTRVSNNYEQYLRTLNVSLRKKYPNIDEKKADELLTAWETKKKELISYERKAAEDWKKAKEKEPGISRVQWEDSYGYRYGQAMRRERRDIAYAQYLDLFSQYPVLNRVATALGRLQDPRISMNLPMDNSEVEDPNQWSPFLKTFIDFDADAFAANDASTELEINQSTSRSTSYETRWSGSISAGSSFWSFGGDASGGTVDQHLRSEALSFRVKFKNLAKFTVIRGIWYDETLIRTYSHEVDKSEFWGPTGQLNLIPEEILIGRGVTVEVDTKQTSFDYFKNWYQANARGGFSLGPFKVGGGGSSSATYEDIRNASDKTTIRIQDDSSRFYILAVVSLKCDELSALDYYRSLLEKEGSVTQRLDEEWQKSFARALRGSTMKRAA